jgi:hypothetical protein
VVELVECVVGWAEQHKHVGLSFSQAKGTRTEDLYDQLLVVVGLDQAPFRTFSTTLGPFSLLSLIRRVQSMQHAQTFVALVMIT